MARLFAWASFAPTRIRPTGPSRALSRSRRRPHSSIPRAAHLTVLPSGGPLAPCGLEQPLPFTSPASDVPCRRRGHRPAGSSAGDAAGARPDAPFDACNRALDPRGLDRLASTLAGPPRDDRDAFRRVTPGARCLAPPSRVRHVDRELALLRAPFSPRSRLPCVRQHAVRSASRPAPVRRLALRLADACRTRDASDRLLPSHFFIRAPVPRWFPGSIRASLGSRVLPGDRLMSRQSDSLRRAAPGSSVHRGRALSSPRSVCGASLWHPCRVSRRATLARARPSRRQLPRPHPRSHA